MEKLNVLYILTKLELGGAQKVCLTLHKGLTQDHHNAMLLSGAEGVLKQEASKTPGCIFLNSFKREVSLRSIFDDFKTFISLTQIIKQLKKQYPNLIVHTHSTKAGIIGRWAAFFAGVSHRVHTVHGFGFHNYQKRHKWLIIVALEWVTTLITSKIICVSLKDQEQGNNLLPGFINKSILIRAAVTDDHFKQAKRVPNKAPNTITIGTISCFKPQKNLFDLLDAFGIVHFDGASKGIEINLEIIGDGEQLTAIESWIATHNLKKNIQLLGWQHDVKPFLYQWDIFALSSLWEGLPCSVVEARLAGLPVVAYDVGGISEIITHGSNGYLVPPGKKMLLASHLQELIYDKNLRKQQQSYQDNLISFSTRSMINEHEKLYNNFEIRR